MEDLIDTGTTLMKIGEKLRPGTESLEFCTLLRNKGKNAKLEVKFCGLECEKFIIGYGMDYDQSGRNFPHIYSKIE